MKALADYAKIVQNNNMVPMVEPEVLMDGDHSVQSCFEATAKCLKTLFSMLDANDVSLKGTILKPNMVVSGTEAPIQASVCLLYTSPSPRDGTSSRMPSSA